MASSETISLLKQLKHADNSYMVKVEGTKKPKWLGGISNYSIGRYPVTQGLWKEVMGEGNNPSYFKGDLRPLEQVSWNDIKNEFLIALEKKTGKPYRLPTEAEWEYAAKGGRFTKGFKYSGSNKLKEVGWYDANSHGETKDVGLKLPNELGIYDMSGNVWEWCEDLYDANSKNFGDDRVLRGGSWIHLADLCRVSHRYWGAPDLRNYDLGFRLVLSP